MQAIDWTYGDEIRKARTLAGMKQAELADRIGVSRPLISKFERGVSEPTISQWRAIERETGVQLSVYLTSDTTMRSNSPRGISQEHGAAA